MSNNLKARGTANNSKAQKAHSWDGKRNLMYRTALQKEFSALKDTVMTALRTSSLPFPLEGRSPTPPHQGRGQQHHVMSVLGAASPGEAQGKERFPPIHCLDPWLHLGPPGHLPVSPHRALAMAPPLSRAAKSSGEGLKLPRWGRNPSGVTWGSPRGHEDGGGGTHPSSTRRHWGARDPASIARCRAPHRGIHEPVLWISKCFDEGLWKESKQWQLRKKNTKPLPITEVSFKTLVCYIVLNARSVYLRCHFQVFSPSCTELVPIMSI